MFGTSTLFKTAWPRRTPHARNAFALSAPSWNQYVRWCSLYLKSPTGPLSFRKLLRTTWKNSLVTPGPAPSSPSKVTRKGLRNWLALRPSNFVSTSSSSPAGSRRTSICKGMTRPISSWICSQMSQRRQTRRKLTGTRLLWVRKEQKSAVNPKLSMARTSGTVALGCSRHRCHSEIGSHLLMPSRTKLSYSTLGPRAPSSSNLLVLQGRELAEYRNCRNPTAYQKCWSDWMSFTSWTWTTLALITSITTLMS
mmetsp:Transcript_39968/g.115169  ORF Transcript_39968/g.115169 Transcript_39968/m.115169 type:complete len:252 (+) Transcript_39968:908-1663(+)